MSRAPRQRLLSTQTRPFPITTLRNGQRGQKRPVVAVSRNWQEAKMDDEPVVIQTAVSADGTKRWHLRQRSDGFLAYDEDTFFTEDLSEFDAGIMEYWSPTHFSGLFNDTVGARIDALGTLPWLNEVLATK
jgi:hypothetical protein